jgi:hypothetical protein
MMFDHAAKTRRNESRGHAKDATGVIVWLQNLARRSQTARTDNATDEQKIKIAQFPQCRC